MITITSRPRAIVLGSNQSDWSAAHNPVIYDFLRQDTFIISVTIGIDLQALVNVSVNLTTVLFEGDGIFIESDNYSIGGLVRSVTATEIQTDIDYTVDSFGGYINHRKNWRLEISLFNAKTDQKILTNLLQYQSAPNGEAKPDFKQYLKAQLQSNNAFNYNVLNLADSLMSIGFYIKYNEDFNGNPFDAIITDVSNPTFVTDSAKQIGERFGQNMGEFVPFTQLLTVANIAGPVDVAAVDAGEFIYYVGTDAGLFRAWKVDPIQRIVLTANISAIVQLTNCVYVSDNDTLYTTTLTTDQILKLDGTTLANNGSFSVDTDPGPLAYASDEQEIWVAGNSFLRSYLISTDAVNHSIALVGIKDIVYVQEFNRVYAITNTTVTSVDASTGTVISTESVPGGATGRAKVIKNDFGVFVVYVNFAGDINVINAQNNQSEMIFAVGNADSMAYDINTQTVFIHKTDQTLIQVDTLSFETLNVFDLENVDSAVIEMIVSNGALFMAELNDEAFYKLLPPPELARFLTLMEVPKLWKNYPFDLSFIFNNKLGSRIIARSVEQFSNGVSSGPVLNDLDETQIGFANRLTVGDLDEDTDQIKVTLINTGPSVQYKRPDYDDDDYS